MNRRVALVTGVSGGLGRAIATRFGAEGWDVIGADRIPSDESPTLSRFIEVDVSTPAGTGHLIAEVAALDGLDALVNNAALQVNHALVDTTDDEWDSVMATNVRAAFQLIRGLAPKLAARRGSVVNVSSVHALATSVNVAAYAVSKGALASLTRTAALELGPLGIRCNAVLPGAIMTPMLTDGLERRPHERGAQGNLDALAASTPLGFVATPDQIAPTIVHLADSAASPYTTGALLTIDGGAVLRLGTE